MKIFSDDQLLAEVEDVIRTMPAAETMAHDDADVLPWLGRATAVIREWDSAKAVEFAFAVDKLGAMMGRYANQARRTIQVLLHQARLDLRMQTVGPLSVNVGAGPAFDYFDELRKVIEAARGDILFVDPYLDSEFVSRPLGHIAPGTRVRLFGRERMTTLLPAVELFRQQSPLSIEVRSASGLNNRYVLIDGTSCFQSGASFKDGAKKASTTLTQITDAFSAVNTTYEQLWSSATARSQSPLVAGCQSSGESA